MVSAEIPDEHEDPELYQTVTTSMMHGPCGHLNPNAPCMRDGKCSKNFPKEFRDATAAVSEKYVQYRRRDDGRTVKKSGVELDNRWVVPYNRALSKKFNAHINIEICSNIQVVKYIHKYVYKGHDRISAAVVADNSDANLNPNDTADQDEQQNGNPHPQQDVIDEIARYLDCRYISASESCWRMFGFEICGQYPAVEQLAVHLPNQQKVYIKRGESRADAMERSSRTMLTEWFELNRRDPAAPRYIYDQIPRHYVWNKHKKI